MNTESPSWIITWYCNDISQKLDFPKDVFLFRETEHNIRKKPTSKIWESFPAREAGPCPEPQGDFTRSMIFNAIEIFMMTHVVPVYPASVSSCSTCKFAAVFCRTFAAFLVSALPGTSDPAHGSRNYTIGIIVFLWKSSTSRRYPL